MQVIINSQEELRRVVEKLERLVYGKKTGVNAQRGVKF